MPGGHVLHREDPRHEGEHGAQAQLRGGDLLEGTEPVQRESDADEVAGHGIRAQRARRVRRVRVQPVRVREAGTGAGQETLHLRADPGEHVRLLRGGRVTGHVRVREVAHESHDAHGRGGACGGGHGLGRGQLRQQ